MHAAQVMWTGEHVALAKYSICIFACIKKWKIDLNGHLCPQKLVHQA